MTAITGHLSLRIYYAHPRAHSLGDCGKGASMPPHPLTLLEAQAWVLIISALVTAALSIITAIVTAILLVRTGRIHTLVNSALDKEKLKITMLESLLMAKQLELEAAEKAR